MTIFKHILDYFLKLGVASKVVFILFFVALIVTVGESLYSVYVGYNASSVPAAIYLGLPSYNGPCPEDISRAYEVFRQSSALDDQMASKDIVLNQKAYDDVRNKMLAVIEQSQFCEDPEAQGRVLYIAASIEIQGGIHNFRPIKQVMASVQSLYIQAGNIGYNRLHPEEALWLHERIVRNGHRAGIKIDIPSPDPVAPDHNKRVNGNG